MDQYQILDSLNSSWTRGIVLSKIKKGETSENIVNDFIKENQEDLLEVSNLIKEKNPLLFEQIEILSDCETRLIKKIKEFNYENLAISNQKAYPPKRKFYKFNFGLFMIKWSNKFVMASLITISLISLTKQAWA